MKSGAAASYPSVSRTASESSTRSIARKLPAAPCGARSGRLRRGSRSRLALRSTLPDRGRQRLEVRLTRERRVERLQLCGGTRATSGPRRHRVVGRTRSVPGDDPPVPDAGQTRRSLRRPATAPTPRPARPRRDWRRQPDSVRSARRAASVVNSAARSKSADAARSPPRDLARSAARSSSSAISSSCVTVAFARCHTRRSGSTIGSVTSASAR